MRKLLSIAVTALSLYALWLLMLYFMQGSMMYPGAHMALPQSEPPDGVEAWQIKTESGDVEAWWMPPAGPPEAVVIFAHGNAELIDYAPDEAGRLRQLGISVLAVEYPGYGRSAGRPSQESIAQAFCNAWDRVRSIHPDLPVIGWGRSLGGGAIAGLATCRQLDGMILESSFASARDFARRYLAPGALMRDGYDVESVLRDYAGPVLITHGKHDGIVPYAHSERLLAAARNGQHVTLDCGHNDCPPDWAAYLQLIHDFLTGADLLKDTQS